MLLLILPLALAIHDLRDLPCPVAEDIAPCRCWVYTGYRVPATLGLDCSDVTSDDQLAEIFAGYFPFKNFQSIDIHGNRNLKVLRSGVFGDLTFERLELSENQLEEVQEGALSGSFTTAKTIDVSVNTISSFPFLELEGFSQLRHFHIDNNRISDIPSLKSSSLTWIDFQRNPLNSLPAAFHLPNLTWCDFGRNDISQIASGMFSGLPNLSRIYLNWNNLEHIPSGAIQLNDMDLDGNTNLRPYIDLTNNRISSIEVGAVTGIRNGWILLPHNRLVELDEAVFRPLLDDGNMVLHTGMFSGLPNLSRIDLNWNNLEHIPSGAIQLNDMDLDNNTNNLRPYLDLANNRISSIEVGAVTGIKNGWILLPHNRLEELDEAVFRPLLDDGNMVLLTGNPLKCGCDIEWLISNQGYMDQLLGDGKSLRHDTCHNGTKLVDLDPQFYKENC